MLLQLSTVSKKMARAAANLLHSSSGLRLYSTEDSPLLFQSSLMLSWAPLLNCLCLWDQRLYTSPGLHAFLQAASNLGQILAVCNSAMDAAQLGCLLHVCGAEHVELRGASLPGRFPPEMSSLHVMLDNTIDGEPGPEWDLQMPSTLVYHLLHHDGLEGLGLNMVHHSKFALACPMLLPELHISLRFRLQVDSVIDLSWLQRQPGSVSLTIYVLTSDMLAHQALIGQLQRISIHDLWLEVQAPLTAQVQVLWKQVTVRELCRLLVSCPFSNVSGAVQALPKCGSFEFIGSSCEPSALFVRWSALDQPCKIRFQLAPGWVLNLVGDPSLQMETGDQPWQLSVDAGCKVHGLPAGCMRDDGSWLMQNAAAVSAGI